MSNELKIQLTVNGATRHGMISSLIGRPITIENATKLLESMIEKMTSDSPSAK
jgi:hypothetical protein